MTHMWTTASCKKKAWHNLAPNYGWALLIVLISLLLHNVIESVLSGISGLPIPIFAIGKAVFSIFSKGTQMNWQDAADALHPLFQSMMISFLVICAVAVLLNVIYAVFIKNPVHCGLMYWFMSTREEKVKPIYAPVFRVFLPGTYRVIVKGMAWRFLWNSIWMMASCIPLIFPVACTVLFAVRPIEFVASIRKNAGISSSSGWLLMGLIFLFLYVIAFVLCVMIMLHRRYAYFYVPFLLLGEPELGYRKTLRKSKSMSKGQKSRMFLLDLSFIGWWILVVLSGGLLMFALLPYIYATYTELYNARRDEMCMVLTSVEMDIIDSNINSDRNDIESVKINT